METTAKKPSRKKFIGWGTALLAAVAAWRFFPVKPKANSTTVKMLTRDGKLVEVDKRFLASGGEKIKTKELQDWVKKTPSTTNNHGE